MLESKFYEDVPPLVDPISALLMATPKWYLPILGYLLVV
jgi:hypothetical protein